MACVRRLSVAAARGKTNLPCTKTPRETVPVIVSPIIDRASLLWRSCGPREPLRGAATQRREPIFALAAAVSPHASTASPRAATVRPVLLALNEKIAAAHRRKNSATEDGEDDRSRRANAQAALARQADGADPLFVGAHWRADAHAHALELTRPTRTGMIARIVTPAAASRSAPQTPGAKRCCSVQRGRGCMPSRSPLFVGQRGAISRAASVGAGGNGGGRTRDRSQPLRQASDARNQVPPGRVGATHRRPLRYQTTPQRDLRAPAGLRPKGLAARGAADSPARCKFASRMV
jgi:hypothetical protein